MPKIKVDFDSPWKNILDVYFENFIAYCWPDKYTEIDWNKGYKTLDKELHKIAKNAPIGNRIADKLIEVHLKNGKIQAILIHVEVHGRAEQDFGEKMFVYRYRLRDKYGKPIASLAILIDDNPKWRPNYFKEELWGTSVEMKFEIVKILDYKNRIEELEASSNPFAQIILAQLAALEKQLPEDKLTSKINLIKQLYRRKWKKKDILNLLEFTDWLIALPLSLELEFQETVKVIEEKSHMKNRPKYVTSFERIGIQKGEGMLLIHLLKRKFNALPKQYRQKIKQASSDDLLKWGERVLDTPVLEDIFED